MPAGIVFAGFGSMAFLYVLLCYAAWLVLHQSPVRAVQSEQAWVEKPFLQSDQRSLTGGSEGVGMSTVSRLRDTNGRAGRAPRHDLYKVQGTFKESSVCLESLAVCHKDQWTWGLGKGRTVLTFPKKQMIFSQGEAAGSVFYIQAGQVKVTVVSPQGKEAIVAMLERGAFFGESCLAGATVRTKTAIAMEDSCLVRIDKDVMICLLHEEPTFSELFLTYLLSRNVRMQEDVVDQLFNSSEKRLARALLLLAPVGEEGKPEAVIPKINQETLAEMIGTTRARVSCFMNKFRKMGFIDYTSEQHANGELHVHRSLRTVLLHD